MILDSFLSRGWQDRYEQSCPRLLRREQQLVEYLIRGRGVIRLLPPYRIRQRPRIPKAWRESSWKFEFGLRTQILIKRGQEQ